MHKSLRFIIISLLISVAVISVYRNVGECEFIGFDDDLYVSDNAYVKQGLTFESIQWAFTASHASTWQPLVWLSYMTESHFLGNELSPKLFHWTNLILHLLNTVLLLYLLYMMTSAFWPCVFVSALFGLHPVHTESVVWVAERKDVLSTFFWMLTMILYVKYTRKPSKATYAAFAGSFILGLMAKPMLITAPIIMLLLDYWPLRRSAVGFKCLMIEKMPLLLPVVISCIVTFIVQRAGGSVATLDAVPLVTRIANVPVFYTQYLHKLIWPDPLAVLYLHPGMPMVYQVFIGALILTLISYLSYRWRHQYPFVLAGWLWFLLTMLPVIGLITFGLHGIADRFLYIPAIGIYVMLAFSAARLVSLYPAKGIKSIVCIVSLCLLAGAGLLTARQVRYWEGNITLFSHAIDVTDDNWAMYNCLGAARDRAGDLDGALESFRIAAELNPERPRLFYNIGCTLHKKGELDAAASSYRIALGIDPNHLKARYNLGVALEQQRRYAEALREYKRVIDMYPDHLMAYNNIGTVYTKQGETELAMQNYRNALAIDPDYIKARYNLGALLFQSGQLDDAAKEFVIILNNSPNHLASRKSLKLTLTKIAQEQKSKSH